MPAPYAAFLGTWILDPALCDYEQGSPPQRGRYTIEERDDGLHFTIEWADHEGKEARMSPARSIMGLETDLAITDLADRRLRLRIGTQAVIQPA